MAIDIDSAEGQIIRKFVPLATLSNLHFEALCTELTVEQGEKGSYLFKQGEDDQDLIYLLDGEVSLQAEGFVVEAIKAGSIAAQFALAHQNPRQIDALAKSNVQYLSFKRDLLDKPPTVYIEQEDNYIVKEDQEDDWMAMLLRSPLFRHLSAQSLQQILLAIEEVSFGKEKNIISQGDKGKYFYLIKRGQCQASRKATPTAKAIKLAQFRSGNTFGEDALISDEPNDFSVLTLSDCSLLRLSKEKFLALIKEPSLNFINYEQLVKHQQKGAIIIDVRLPDEFKIKHLEGSINLPFFSLRMQMKNLDKEQTIVVTCKDGKISEAASFLLFKYNFEPLVLKGGIKAIKQDISKPSATFKIFDGIGVVLNHDESSSTKQKEQKPDENVELTINRHAVDFDETEDAAESEINLDITQIDAYESNLADQLESLTEENKRLKQTAHKLHLHCKKLLEDKSKLEKQLILVIKQKSEIEKQLQQLTSQ